MKSREERHCSRAVSRVIRPVKGLTLYSQIIQSDAKRSYRICAALNWPYPVMEESKSSAERYVEKDVELLHCKEFNVEMIPVELENVTLRSN